MRKGRVLHSQSMNCLNTTKTILKTLQSCGFSASLTEITDGVRCMALTETPPEKQQPPAEAKGHVPNTAFNIADREALRAPCVPNEEQILQDINRGIQAHHPVIRNVAHVPRDWAVYLWNINGLKNALKRNVLRDFFKVFYPTVICLSEIKQRGDKLFKLSKRLVALLSEFGYTSYLFNTCDIPETGYS